MILVAESQTLHLFDSSGARSLVTLQQIYREGSTYIPKDIAWADQQAL